tara:strand:- start:607 stop:1413 length:807 start_codon:yes stop_codon:yes gene_type:complete
VPSIVNPTIGGFGHFVWFVGEVYLMAKKSPQTTSGIEHIAEYPRPYVAVDLVILTVLDADLKVLLIRREKPPFEGGWALPGGFVRVGATAEDQGEDLEDAARRELEEETGLSASAVYLEQLRAFGTPGRDPRMRVITVAYFALIRPDLAPFVQAGGDALQTDWFSTQELSGMDIAFDHEVILESTLAHIRKHVEGSSMAFELVPRSFSISELRAVYDVIRGETHDPGNFRRRFLRMVDDGLIEEAPGKRITTSRPAKVYRFKAPQRQA